ncbi:alpha/beta fold hydrolase [Agrobacterium pusense]|uniref:alpha/beta fold hydrolase n=1 Tax=Agrobacterium pusense TaxID=648995 RepID=UPI003FD0728C
MSVIVRNNVTEQGGGQRSIVFAHGFGCDQNMWRYVAPAFEQNYKVVLFDHVGCGKSDLGAYDPAKYSSLSGYATDVVEIGRALDIKNGVFVGHSVSAMIGILASIEAPDLFCELILIGPSPRYINDDGYEGGFTRGQIEELLEFLDDNHMGWSAAMGPVIMGNPDRPELSEELVNSFCRTDPDIAKAFARVTFLSDNRSDLKHCQARALVIQCKQDVIAQQGVGEFVRDHLPRGEMVVIDATGHCPNLSAPAQVISAIKAFV